MKKSLIEFSSDWIMGEVVNGNWTKEYTLDRNAPLSVRFNDNQKFIQALQMNMKDNGSSELISNSQNKFIKELMSVKVWLRNQDQVIEMNLYDIYNGLIKHLKDDSFEDQLFNSNEVSFMGPLGPFKHMSLIDCLNNEITEKLIFTKVIKNQLPARKMRILTEGKIQVAYGVDFEKMVNLNVRQITNSGILFSCLDDQFLGEMDQSEFFKFFFDTTWMKKFVDGDLSLSNQAPPEFYFTEDHLRYFFIEGKNIMKSLSYQSGTTNEVFLFVRYLHMLESDVPNIFYEFCEKVNAQFKKVS